MGIKFVQTAVIDHIVGVGVGVAVFLHQVGDHVLHHQIHVVVLGLLTDVAALEYQLLIDRVDVLVLGDEAALVHFGQHQLLTLTDVFGVGIGVVDAGVVGDAGQHRALSQCTLLQLLAEVGAGADTHAHQIAGHRHVIEVAFYIKWYCSSICS